MAQSKKKRPDRTPAEHLESLAPSTKTAVIKALAKDAEDRRRVDAHRSLQMAEARLPVHREPFDKVQARIMAPARPNLRTAPPKSSEDLKPKRKAAKQHGTGPEAETLAMIHKAWPDAVVEDQYKMHLAEECDYSIDFRLKYDGDDIRVEAKGPFTREDSRIKFKFATALIRWAFFIWAKQDRRKAWKFEVWHAGSRLKLTGKHQNPKSMAECAKLIRETVSRMDRLAEGGE